MLLCLQCMKEVEDNDPRIADKTHPNYGGCPECGARTIPCDITNDTVEIKLTWHELRILVMWAERWADRMQEPESSQSLKTVYNIADRIHMQHMNKPSLTFRGELTDLAQLPGVTVIKQNVLKEPQSGE